ncbi:alpha/beta hydrolase-fold protein [Escherichia coli]
MLDWLSGRPATSRISLLNRGCSVTRLSTTLLLLRRTPVCEAVMSQMPTVTIWQGAGFYLNATQAPWNEHYKMDDYIRNELPDHDATFPVTTRKSISGDPMGGLGALVLALRNPDEYVSVSAFSPIVSPSQVPWGQQAFAAYLGENKDAWLDYDPVSLISQGQRVAEIMVDQGLSDDFYAEQLRTRNLENICQEMNIKTLIRYHEGYDHSHYFVSSLLASILPTTPIN